MIDILIITVCLIVIIGSLTSSSIANSQAFKVGKVLRIFRLFLMFRKVNTIRMYKEKITKKKNLVVNLSSPSEKVIEMLSGLLEADWVSYNGVLKADIEWSITMIKEQKIYQTNVRAVKEELREYVNWAVHQSPMNDPNSPAKTETFVQVIAVESYSKEIEALLADVHKWEFDIFRLEAASESKSLEIVTTHLLSLYDSFHSQNLDNQRFSSFIKAIQDGYHKDNTYHNSTHAADVVQSFHYLLTTCQGIDICMLQESDVAACLISAAIHDYDHPGFNNLFLINSSHAIALTYNDKSVLENYHVASSFKLISEEKNNFFINISKEERRRYRMRMIAIVLATDFSRHFADLGKFQLKFSSGVFKDEEEDKSLAMEMMMHTSDIGNPSRPWRLCYDWADKVMAEFFQQGDKERELGLPISNLCDRNSVSIPKSQIGFTELFIEPTFNLLENLLPRVSENIQYISENKEKWRQMLENNKN